MAFFPARFLSSFASCLLFAAEFAFLRAPTSRCTRRLETSAGVTPPIRLAWPTVVGAIFASFSRASMRRVVTDA